MLELQLPVAREPINAPPRLVMLSIHNGCNVKCSYCFVEKTPEQMTLPTVRKVVNFLLGQRGHERSTRINLFGGEPFLAPEAIRELITYGNKSRPNVYHRFEFSATTNGTIATPEIESLIREGKMQLLVSLDGTAEANRERPFLSGRPSHAAVVRNMPKFLQWTGGRRVTVRMTFYPSQQALDFVKNVEFVRALGVSNILLCPVAESDWLGWELRLEEAYQNLAEWFMQQLRAGRDPGLDITWNYLKLYHHSVSGGPSELNRPCQIGKEVLGIDVHGNLMPCHRFLYRPQDWLGNVEQVEFHDDRQKYLHLSSSEIERCHNCPRALCGGGCRVLAIQAGQGLHGHHPHHCLLLQAHIRAVERIYATMKTEKNKLFQHLIGQGSQAGHGVQLSAGI